MSTLNRDESLFYCDIPTHSKVDPVINALREYSIQNAKQVYIIKKPLGVTKNYNYTISDVAIILMPKHPILVLHYGEKNIDALDEYLLDI